MSDSWSILDEGGGCNPLLTKSFNDWEVEDVE